MASTDVSPVPRATVIVSPPFTVSLRNHPLMGMLRIAAVLAAVITSLCVYSNTGTAVALP